MTKPPKLKDIHGPRAALGEAVVEELIEELRKSSNVPFEQILGVMNLKLMRDGEKIVPNVDMNFLNMDTGKVAGHLQDFTLIKQALQRINEKTGGVASPNETQEVIGMKGQLRRMQPMHTEPGMEHAAPLVQSLLRTDHHGHHYLDEKALNKLIKHINDQPDVAATVDLKQYPSDWRIAQLPSAPKKTRTLE